MNILSEKEEDALFEKVESLNIKYYNTYDKIINVQDDSVYLAEGGKLYEVFWELFSDKNVRDRYPKEILGMFNTTFDWAVMMSEGVLSGINPIKINVFIKWINTFGKGTKFMDDFIEILDDFQKIEDTRTIVFTWSAVVDYVNIFKLSCDVDKYYDEGLKQFIISHKKNKKSDGTGIGRRSLILLSMIYFLKGKKEFEAVFFKKSFHWKFIKKYVGKDYWKIFRLFESYALDSFNESNPEFKRIKKVDPGMVYYHYTSVNVLYDILKNKRIMFSDSEKYVDDDEGKMLLDNPEPVYSLSLTKNGDSEALWGNYTNNVGIAIELDFLTMMNSFNVVPISIKETKYISSVAYKPFEMSKVIYGRKYKESLRLAVKASNKIFKKIFGKEDMDKLAEQFYSIQTHFLKVKPFEYEEEFRITIPKEHIDKGEILGGLKSLDGLFININPERLIKRIIISPSLKLMEYDYSNLKTLLKNYGLEKSIVESAATIKLK